MPNYNETAHTYDTRLNIEANLDQFLREIKRDLKDLKLSNESTTEKLRDLKLELIIDRALLDDTVNALEEEIKMRTGYCEFIEQMFEARRKNLITSIVEFAEDCYDELDKNFIEEEIEKCEFVCENECMPTDIEKIVNQEYSIYFIRNTVNGYVKIGVSIRPDLRMNALQTACGDRLEILGILRPLSKERAFCLEKKLHEYFWLWRKVPGSRKTEWFDGIIESKIQDSLKHFCVQELYCNLE